jgi:hypothetical protein
MAMELGLPLFATVGSMDSLMHTEMTRRVVIRGAVWAVSLTAAFALISYVLLHAQRVVNRAGPQRGQAISVFVVKWIDSVLDASALLCVSLTYAVLISAVPFSKGAALLPELLAFSLLLVVFVAAFTTAFEALPSIWAYPAHPTPAAVTANRHVSQWFAGKVQSRTLLLHRHTTSHTSIPNLPI